MADFNNCFSITDTTYICKKLLNLKYRLIEDKRIEISTLLSVSFKKTEISKQLNICKMTVHGAEQRLKTLRVAEGLSSTRKTSGYTPTNNRLKGLRKRPMPETDKTGTS